MGLKMKPVEEVSGPVSIPRPGDIDCSRDVPIVKQEFKDECDVNLIIARCLRSGVPLPNWESIAPVFADVSEIGDYRDVLHRIQAADAAFMALDAKVRSRFANDPGEFMRFMNDPGNVDEAVALGLLKAPQAKPEEQPEPKAKAFVSKAKPPKEAPPSED